jgi:hypothetical protein
MNTRITQLKTIESGYEKDIEQIKIDLIDITMTADEAGQLWKDFEKLVALKQIVHSAIFDAEKIAVN